MSIETNGSTRKDAGRRVVRAREVVQERFRSTRSALGDGLGKARIHVEQTLRANPAKWAAIAGCAGLALGLAGRWMRSKDRSRRERYVILEAC